MSEETIAVSRTESPLSFEDTCPIKLPHPETLQLEENTLKNESVGNIVTVVEPYSAKITVVDGSCDSVCQRSHYSSPDLGIESDPNHESSAPEHKEDGANKYQMFPFKLQPSKTTFTESTGRWSGIKYLFIFFLCLYLVFKHLIAIFYKFDIESFLQVNLFGQMRLFHLKQKEKTSLCILVCL